MNPTQNRGFLSKLHVPFITCEHSCIIHCSFAFKLELETKYKKGIITT